MGLCCAQAMLEQAGELHDRAVKLAEKLFGPESEKMGTSLNNKAELLRQMVSCCCGFVRAVEHVSVLRNSQTPPPCMQGKSEEALPLFTRSREIFEKVLGQDHPNVATLLNNEALLLKKMVRVVDASCVVVGAVESPPRGRAVE